MKLLELQLRAFGPFTDTTLTLPADKRMHVIYGPNEAGKSSALRAITALLYGIPGQSPDNFLHEYGKIRIGGRLADSAGQELAVVRRKGNARTLADLQGTVLDEAVLRRFLGHLDADTFRNCFGLNYERFVQGGADILEGRGDLGQALFAAAAGGARPRLVLKRLEEEADKLYKPQGRNQLIPTAVAAYKEEIDKVQTVSLRPSDWEERDAAHKKARADREKVIAEYAGLFAERAKLERWLKAAPLVRARRSLQAELEAMGEVVRLPAGAAEERRAAQKSLVEKSAAADREQERLARLDDEMRRRVVPEELLREAVEIERLQEQRGSCVKAAADAQGLRERRDRARAEAAAILQELRPGTALDAAAGLRVPADRRARIHELGNHRQALRDRAAGADKVVRKLQADIAAAGLDLAKLPPPRDVRDLKAAVVRTRKQGDLEKELRDAAAAAARLQRQIELDLKKLPWAGALEELEALPIPAEATIQKFERSLAEEQAALAGIDERLDRERAEGVKIDAELDALRRSGSVPSEADLTADRIRRDDGWRLVRAAWLASGSAGGGRQPPDPPNKGADAPRPPIPPEDLAQTYEASVTKADQTADRLRRETERVARQAALTARRESIRKECDRLAAERHAVLAGQAVTQAAWSAAWRGCGVEPLSPREMQGWVQRQARLCEAAAALRDLRAKSDSVRQRIDEHAAALRSGLTRLGESAPPDAGMDSLAEIADRVIDRISGENEHRKSLSGRIVEWEATLRDAIEERGRAEELWARWKADWAAAVADLGLRAEATPPEAAAVLTRYDELFAKLKEADAADGRVRGIDHDAEQFRLQVGRLTARATPDLSARPADEVTPLLKERLTAARAANTALAESAKRRKDIETSLAAARDGVREATGTLARLCRQAGVPRPEDLPAMEDRSDKAARFRDELEQTDKQLRPLCAGGTVAQLVKEVEDCDPAALPDRLRDLSERIADLERRRDDLGPVIGALQRDLERMDGSAAAAEAAERAEGLLARIRDHVERYVRLRLAAVVLKRQMERYRDENQGPLLQRAGELFARLTLGSFSGLTTEFGDADEPVVVGLRPGGGTVSAVGMSDGSREQLYLALFLATLEKRLAAGEPMPFVLDDILVNFDDDRAAATLRVLADISEKTQVLFFTHHSHLADLAKASIPSGVMQVHRLPGRMPAGR